MPRGGTVYRNKETVLASFTLLAGFLEANAPDISYDSSQCPFTL